MHVCLLFLCELQQLVVTETWHYVLLDTRVVDWKQFIRISSSHETRSSIRSKPSNMIFVLLSGVWVLFAAVFYACVLFAILKNRRKSPFDSSYFELFVYTGYLDLIVVAYIIFYVKLPLINLFPGPYMLEHADGSLVKVGMILACTLQEAQHLYVLIAAANRYSAICMPTKYNRIWTSKMIKILCILSIFITNAVHIRQWGYEIRAGVSNTTGGVELFHVRDDQRKRVYTFGALRMAAYANITAVLYAIVVVTMIKKSTGVVDATTASRAELKAARRERRLALSSLSVFICQLLTLVYFALVVVWGTNRGVVKYFYYFAGDLLTTVNPFALVALSTAARECVLSTFGGTPRRSSTTGGRTTAGQRMSENNNMEVVLANRLNEQ